MLAGIAFLIHLVATVAMAAIIWTMQLVHYPVFALADRERFPEFARRHTKSISKLLMPLMILEAISAVLLVFHPHESLPTVAAALGAGLLLLIWISTFALQVPCHRILAKGYDATVHRRLLRTNWLRTGAWTARAGIVVWGMAR